MPTPAELAQSHTDLKPEELEHLQRLLGSWSVLADLSFSDLLLLVPVQTEGEAQAREAGEDPELVVLGQMRPNNRPTLVDQDLVGQTVNESQWTLVARCLHSGEIVRGSIHHPILGEQVPVENIPVRFEGRIIAALLRVSLAPLKGPTSMYERTYLDVFERLADMVAQSAFPFPDEDVGTEEAPRVGDGVVVVDADGRVEFASPNAMNAFHRMGIYTQPEGRRFGDLDIEESAVEWALATGRPVVEEVERRPDVIVLVHCIPLLSHGVVTGAMILLRDVTDVRRLDRLLLSKDAAIREVHHRVKNNLQTISSLLSLQARRVGDRAARVALHEAERRVRSIALVHEILSRDPSDQVPFAEIVASLVQMAEDSVVSSQPIVISVHGDLGEVTADVATPLAVTVAELLQNAVEHAFDPEAGAGTDWASGLEGAGGAAGAATVGHVDLTMSNEETDLRVEVRDDGLGLPDGFDIERTSSLGLSIVRDLVVSQLEGTISMEAMPADEGGGRGWRSRCRCGHRDERGAPVGWPAPGGSTGAPGARCSECGALRTACGQPRLAQLAALLLGGAAPHARLLVRRQCEVQAGLERFAGAADALRGLDLVDGRAGRADREEEVRFGVAAGGHPPPVVRVPVDCPVPHESHRMCLHQHCDPFHMIGPERCPSVKSGLTGQRVTARRGAGKEFSCENSAARALHP